MQTPNLLELGIQNVPNLAVNSVVCGSLSACVSVNVPLIFRLIPHIHSTLYCGLLRVKCGVSFILLLANRFSPLNARDTQTHTHTAKCDCGDVGFFFTS